MQSLNWSIRQLGNNCGVSSAWSTISGIAKTNLGGDEESQEMADNEDCQYPHKKKHEES
jgi:hypothetical protein